VRSIRVCNIIRRVPDPSARQTHIGLPLQNKSGEYRTDRFYFRRIVPMGIGVQQYRAIINRKKRRDVDAQLICAYLSFAPARLIVALLKTRAQHSARNPDVSSAYFASGAADAIFQNIRPRYSRHSAQSWCAEVLLCSIPSTSAASRGASFSSGVSSAYRGFAVSSLGTSNTSIALRALRHFEYPKIREARANLSSDRRPAKIESERARSPARTR